MLISSYPKPPFLHGAAGVRLDQYIGLPDKRFEQFPALRLFKVERDMILVPAFLEIRKAGPLVHYPVGGIRPYEVAAGLFNPDGFGAKFGEQRRAEASRHAPGTQVQDNQIIQCFRFLIILGRIVERPDLVCPIRPFCSFIVGHILTSL